jgi:D-sedoheptulose 7-phosphate isomerase
MDSKEEDLLIQKPKTFPTLSSQAKNFGDLIAKSEFTDLEGKVLSQEEGSKRSLDLLQHTQQSNLSVFVVGNGGSAAVASHAITDFTNIAGLKSHTLHEPSLLTCMTNDYGYENAFARIFSAQAKKDDLLIAISSSGRSQNIRNTVEVAKKMNVRVLTLSGFDRDNPLKRMGDLNLWLDSHDFGLVEVGHLFVLHYLADRIAFLKKGKGA